MLVLVLFEQPAGSRELSVSVERVVVWQRQPAPLSRPAGESEPPENPVWAVPPGPAAPQLAGQGSVQLVGCYLPAKYRSKSG